MYNDTVNQVEKGETVWDNHEHGLNNSMQSGRRHQICSVPVKPGCTDQAGGADQERAGGLGPDNGSDLERGQRGQVSLHQEDLHRTLISTEVRWRLVSQVR